MADGSLAGRGFIFQANMQLSVALDDDWIRRQEEGGVRFGLSRRVCLPAGLRFFVNRFGGVGGGILAGISQGLGEFNLLWFPGLPVFFGIDNVSFQLRETETAIGRT
jgi:hypothetical protein